MKKILSIILALTFILAFAVIPAAADACFRCNGAGKLTCDDCKGSTKCRFCEGSGINDDGEPCQACINNPGVCARCGGSGMETCPDCGGTGIDPNSPAETTTAAAEVPAETAASNPGGSAPADTTAAATEANTEAAPVANVDAGKTDVNYAPVKISENRQAAMYLGTPDLYNDDFAGTTATGVVDYSKMSPDQQKVYDSIPDEQLAQILGNVQGIISTVQVGDTADESKPVVDEFMKANNITILDDANILPITFDGHIDIGFPIMVSVEVDQDRFDGSKPIHVFHVKEDGSIVQIPDEDVNWLTKEDGKVSRVEYYTDSFSDFLLTDTDGLAIPDAVDLVSSQESVETIGATTEKSGSPLKIIAIVIVVLIAIGALVFFILKNRKTPDALEEASEEVKKVEEAVKDEAEEIKETIEEAVEEKKE